MEGNVSNFDQFLKVIITLAKPVLRDKVPTGPDAEIVSVFDDQDFPPDPFPAHLTRMDARYLSIRRLRLIQCVRTTGKAGTRP